MAGFDIPEYQLPYDELDHPYTAQQALAIAMTETGLRPDACMIRAGDMIPKLRAMGYELTAVKLIT